MAIKEMMKDLVAKESDAIAGRLKSLQSVHTKMRADLESWMMRNEEME